MEILDNKTDYDFNNVIAVEKRENNTKRSYLLVNRYQAKHVPVNPSKARDMFKCLANEVKKVFDMDKKITFIGFAETATAIGASVAEEFGENALYIHTTREDIEEKYNIINFNEEHSHAVNQAVFCSNPKKFFEESDAVVFVEDEVTTGKTILNFVREFKEKGYILENQQVAVASLLNSMEQENVDKYIDLGIDLIYIAKIVNNFESVIGDSNINNNLQQDSSDSRPRREEKENGLKIYEDNGYFDVLHIKGKLDPRLGVGMSEYKKECLKLAKCICNKEYDGRKILVLGTEECMYPAIVCGQYLEEKYHDKVVYTHSTTRSPIVPTNVLKKRNQLDSIYELGRKTFIYNLDKYDHVIIITDAEYINNNGVFTLLEALREYDNKDILLVNWE